MRPAGGAVGDKTPRGDTGTHGRVIQDDTGPVGGESESCCRVESEHENHETEASLFNRSKDRKRKTSA